jgi:hypothetical protein
MSKRFALPLYAAQDVLQHVADLRFHTRTRDLVQQERSRDLGAALAIWHQRALDNMNLAVDASLEKET